LGWAYSGEALGGAPEKEDTEKHRDLFELAHATVHALAPRVRQVLMTTMHGHSAIATEVVRSTRVAAVAMCLAGCGGSHAAPPSSPEAFAKEHPFGSNDGSYLAPFEDLKPPQPCWKVPPRSPPHQACRWMTERELRQAGRLNDGGIGPEDCIPSCDL
jgi:hypothetical protein